MDILSDILASTRLRGAMIGVATLSRPWGIAIDPMRHAAIHVLQQGECWLCLSDGTEPIRISAGDVIFVASGVGHRLSDPADAPVVSLGTALSARREGTGSPVGSESTTLLCARYFLGEAGPHPLILLLPPMIHLTRQQIEASEPLRLLMELLRIEAGGSLSGHDIVAPRLLDTVLVLLLRAWVESQQPGTAGWFGAMRDKGLARALRLIHESPAHPWTVMSLADGALQSRATFARRFTKLVGEPPMAYVTRWRMNVAAKALRESNRRVHEIAQLVGYESAPSFSQSFTRIFGQTPGIYRSSVSPSE